MKTYSIIPLDYQLTPTIIGMIDTLQIMYVFDQLGVLLISYTLEGYNINYNSTIYFQPGEYPANVDDAWVLAKVVEVTEVTVA